MRKSFVGIPHGHTGHVRFLTCVEIASPPKSEPRPKVSRYSLKGSKSLVTQHSSVSSTSSTGSSGSCVGVPERGRLLVISGGDGYEDFRGPQASAELQAGREDSTNHLLLWKVKSRGWKFKADLMKKLFILGLIGAKATRSRDGPKF